ncbi:HAUS augmin-like complex subunit 6 [Nothobranchius furzeri]|uniref:HAUS augmin like complex subunit 6 n=1 Tax=Nothobranchius furzeri TaxID=105023 RepID=A0A1A8A355_NOTFU|nr:HAUS augmin like complex subunit 6 [Nothobranchius furzeri]
MTTSTLQQKENGQYLWFALLGLGFQPDAAASGLSKANIKHLNLGPNMFDKPNKDAFYIVTVYLLKKLNPTRFHEAYRNCWPVLNHKADAEFRKTTCAWLREIMEQTANAGIKVVASLFLSPGGPKFLSLMLHLATHVMLQEMKTFSTGDGWVPEAAAVPTSSLDMAVNRFSLTRTRFLQAAVDQDRFLHEYQRRAQCLVKSERDIRAEGAKYDELLKRFPSDSAPDEGSFCGKVREVRALWSDIEAMLSAIREEQSAVESVLRGDVDQHVLDGTDRALNIPRCLQERVEQLPHQLNSGNVYEDGQLNLLCVMELTNHALQLLKEERRRVPPLSRSQISSQNLQEKCLKMSRVLRDLHLIRQKLSKEEIPEVWSAIRELEADWDKRWMDTLKETPLVSFLNKDPAFSFLSPMAPLTFDPAAEATYRSSVFSQFPAKLPDGKPAERKPEEDGNTRRFSATTEMLDVPAVPTANTSLDWLFDTQSTFPLKAPPGPPLQTSVRKTTHQKTAPLKTKTQIFDLECENLADQFAEAVASASPSGGKGEGLDLENLLGIYQRDPFSTRKQLPRTPESLIMDVKSSWRKAVEDQARTSFHSSELISSVAFGQRPLSQPENVSSDSPAQAVSCTAVPSVSDQDSPSACQQRVAPKASLLWEGLEAEVLDSPSGTGSSVIQFSLEHETLPELPSCDSLSLEDEVVDVTSEEDEEVLIRSLTLKQFTPRRDPNQQSSSGGFSLESMRINKSLLSDSRDKDFLMEPEASAERTSNVFSLDLDSLETPSPVKQDYALPKLITFSPIDDMKC